MGKFLKKFATHSEYETYIASQQAILPNVTYCVDANDVHYNPYVEPVETRLVVKFNVTDTTNPTNIMYSSATSKFSVIEIDGVEQQNVTQSYTFSTTGEHTIKYTLVDPTTTGTTLFKDITNITKVIIPNTVTTIGNAVFSGCTSLTSVGTTGSGASVEIPNTITSIGAHLFDGCNSLTSVTLSNSVTIIDRYAFYNCPSIQNIIIGNSITSIGEKSFNSETATFSRSCTIYATTPPTLAADAFMSFTHIYVPSESVTTYKTANVWSTHEEYIEAIPSA